MKQFVWQTDDVVASTVTVTTIGSTDYNMEAQEIPESDPNFFIGEAEDGTKLLCMDAEDTASTSSFIMIYAGGSGSPQTVEPDEFIGSRPPHAPK